MGEWTTGNEEVSGSFMEAIDINKSSPTLPATPSFFSTNRLHIFLALHCRCSIGPSAESQLLESTEHHLRIPMIPEKQDCSCIRYTDATHFRSRISCKEPTYLLEF